MAPRKNNASIKSTGSTSSKAEPLPDWVKNKNIAKPLSKHLQQQQQQQQQQLSTQAAKVATGNTASSLDAKPPRPPPLFPPGTKTPIALLNERIQKHYASQGWLRPRIEARNIRQADIQVVQEEESIDEKYTFHVTLIKTNKADHNDPYTVRFDARDPSGLEGSSIQLSSKEEAKHYGATYALFRLCSTMSLYQVLPAGPREYWKTLSAHKVTAPEHLNWLWASDPFEAAQKMASEKKAKREAIAKALVEAEKGPKLSRAWQEAREVRMSKEVRDTVEATVKKALLIYPQEGQEGQTEDHSSSELDQRSLILSLVKLGFRKGHASSACTWLGKARRGQATSTVSLVSITHLNDIDACLEYLAIFCPEDDLPTSFAPSIKADSFVVSSAAAGKEEALAVRWIEDRLVKLAGYPRAAVAKCLASLIDAPLEERESLCIEKLLLDLSEVIKLRFRPLDLTDGARLKRAEVRLEERQMLESVLGGDKIKEISPSDRPLNSTAVDHREMYDVIIAATPEDIRLRICPGSSTSYPKENDKLSAPSVFVASSTLPAYLKLALTKRLGRCLFGQEEGYQDWAEILQAGQGGVLLSMVEELESCWRNILDDPPELDIVMRGVTIRKSVEKMANTLQKVDGDLQPSHKRNARLQRSPPKLARNVDSDEELKLRHVGILESTSYRPFKISRAQLPAEASKMDILRLLEVNRLIIISGETGCGKTTQCPQYILDDYIERGQGSLCNIIVTQPRRLSAMGVAARVAAERCEELNGQGQVGYAIRGERRACKNTRLLFSTTGVLLRRLSQYDRDLQGVSHIFVDEVHERGVESDLLLLELKQVLLRNPTLRVVLMSATIDQDFFSAYFDSAPVISIPGRTFPVVDYYLEEVKDMLGRSDEKKRRTKGIDYDLIGQTAQMICERAAKAEDQDGAILIFCPGAGEIRMAVEAIQREVTSRVDVLSLHANMTPEEQRRVFEKMKKGIRKIIVSTNVAETSITIDDVVYVIDLGLVKETRYDPDSGLTRLVETRCSRAASRQRRGRAGRVRRGECFKLYTRDTEEFKMDDQQIPEMKRVALENLILTVKAIKGDNVDVKNYLSEAISPPLVESIDKALILLGEMNIMQGQKLTALGKHVSLLPLDVRLAKLLVFGCIFHCLDSMLTISAIMSCKPLFSGPFEKREELSIARLKFQVASSDILTDANAFSQWSDMRKAKVIFSEVRRWCQDNFLSQSALLDISSTRLDLLGNLREFGFAPFYYGKGDQVSYLDVHSKDVNLKKSLLLAGLYPSVIRIAHPKAKFDQSAAGTVQRESEARQVRYFDATNQRVFIHPSSTLFSVKSYQSDFVTYFNKSVSKSIGSDIGEKIYLRDANEVPIYALLLFGGKIKIHRTQGGISMPCSESQEEGWIKLRANARIATLIQHLRFLLDAALEKSFQDPTSDAFENGLEAEVRDCLQLIFERNGL